MSEQEFDLYLKLLAKCLRLTSGQREQIADELRDHLEERLEELARAGVPREKAVVQALDEFGDAAVLAAHFTTIARLKRRRFLMRLSLGSVGVLTAALLIAFAFWPDNRAVRGPERIAAQEKPKTPPSEPFKRQQKPEAITQGNMADGPTSDKEQILMLKKEREALQSRIDRFVKINQGLRVRVDHPEKEISDLREKVRALQDELQRLAVEAKARPLSSDVFQGSKVEARIADALGQIVDFNIEPQPLQDALEFMAARYSIPIIIDRKALQDANIDLKKENVGLSVSGIPMRDMLELLLNQASPALGYEFRRGVLTVSTIDKIKQHWEIVVYDCRDLIDVGTQDRCAAVAQTSGTIDGQFQFSPEPSKTPAPRRTPNNSQLKTSEDPTQNTPDNGSPEPLRRLSLPLIRTLTAATGTEAWDEESQAGISEFGGLLVVRQNPLVHEQIRRALADIRQMRAHGAYAALGNRAEATTRPTEQPRTQRMRPVLPPTLSPTPAPTRVPSSPAPETTKRKPSGL